MHKIKKGNTNLSRITRKHLANVFHALGTLFYYKPYTHSAMIEINGGKKADRVKKVEIKEKTPLYYSS